MIEPTCYVVLDRSAARGRDLEAILDAVLAGGSRLVQLREKEWPSGRLLPLARRLRERCRRAGATFIVNDRIDLALAADADGVHLGARSLPIVAARRVVGPDLLVGRSVHNLDEAGQAEEDGASYLLVGPVFPTPSHPGEPALGLGPYREAALRAKIPVVAIGGITSDNVRLVAQAGGRGAAAIGAFYAAADPAESARAFRAAFPS